MLEILVGEWEGFEVWMTGLREEGKADSLGKLVGMSDERLYEMKSKRVYLMLFYLFEVFNAFYVNKFSKMFTDWAWSLHNFHPPPTPMIPSTESQNKILPHATQNADSNLQILQPCCGRRHQTPL